MANLHLNFLGSPRVRLDEDDVEIKPRKALALLIYLAVTARRHTRDFLATLLWPEADQRNARHSLRARLSELNVILGGGWIKTDQESISLRTGYWLDVTQFQQIHVKDAANLQTLTVAAELYQDDFLAGFNLPDCPKFDEWQLFYRESLRKSLASIFQKLVNLLNDKADYEKAIFYNRRWLALDPLFEPAHQQLMQLYAQSGQYATALQQYNLCCQILKSELGISETQETTTLYNTIKARSLKISGSISSIQTSPGHNFPTQITPFVGREDELADIQRLLLEEPGCRLLSLVGPGGIGKTRLALQAASLILDGFPDGACFVSLVSVADVQSIVPAIMQALNFRIYGKTQPREGLLDYLRQKRLLIVMDNFEHILDGANILAEILNQAPGITLLVTSRERLSLREEWVYIVEGLSFPAGYDQVREIGIDRHASQTSESIAGFSAVQLFLKRAYQADTRFVPTAEDMSHIGRICQLVEGMPLALELAVPWVSVLSCREIADEIQRNLTFLTTTLHNVPERHRSLGIVFQQTWDRLSISEQTVLQRLSVFRGGCTREAAEKVTGVTLMGLSALVDKALLRRTHGERFELHELLRQFAATRLEEAKQVEAARDIHCLYYTNFLSQREADLKGCRQVAALDEIEADFDNVRTAWLWAVSTKNYQAIGRAVESLFCYCSMRNRYHEYIELQRLGKEQLAPTASCQPHSIWGRIIVRIPTPGREYLEPLTQVHECVETALAIAHKNEDQTEIAFCLWRLGLAVFNENDDFHEALAYCEESLSRFQALGDLYYQAKLLDQTGIWYLRLNQSERGVRLIQQSADLHREIGDKTGLSYSLSSLGWIAYHRGQFVESEVSWHEGYGLTCETRDRQEGALMLMGIAWLTLFNFGDLATAQSLAREVQAISVGINSLEGKRRAHILFGFLAGINEDYKACQQYMQLAGYQQKYTYNISWMIMGLCMAACGKGNVEAARKYLKQVLEMSLDHGWFAVMAQCLPYAAIIKSKDGEVQQAVRLLALAFHHPLSPKGWLEKWPLLARLRSGLKGDLSTASFTRAWEQGQALDLTETVQELLAGIRSVESYRRHQVDAGGNGAGHMSEKPFSP